MSKEKKLITRNATITDIAQILRLTARAYPDFPPYSEAHIRGQINNFPQGQFVAEFDGTIVGYCASFQIAGQHIFKNHSWEEITGSGFGSRHDPQGDYLYGYEVCVDPDMRRYRIGQRLYDERKKLCQYMHLKGIAIVGRLPLLRRRIKKVGNAENYIAAVNDKRIRDSVFLFQMRSGYQYKRLIANYLPSDKESLGYGALMVWSNPDQQRAHINSKKTTSYALPKNKIRIATVQYKQRRVKSFEQFTQYVKYFIDVAAGYRSDFVLFPEWFTMQLLSLETQKRSPSEAILELSKYTDSFCKVMQEYALKYNINIIGGSTSVHNVEAGEVNNVAFIFLRDGRTFTQPKIHPTPDEAYWWNVRGGNTLQAIDTDCGPIGVLICYDSEFPELTRYLVDQGIRILFIPFCTDERKSYLRVRYCAHARAVENQIYVAMAGNVGNLPGVDNMDIQYAQSCILTPSDFPFARDGIAADTSPNVETVSFADLHLDDLMQARDSGTVRNLKDRRHDLYRVKWFKK